MVPGHEDVDAVGVSLRDELCVSMKADISLENLRGDIGYEVVYDVLAERLGRPRVVDLCIEESGPLRLVPCC